MISQRGLRVIFVELVYSLSTKLSSRHERGNFINQLAATKKESKKKVRYFQKCQTTGETFEKFGFLCCKKKNNNNSVICKQTEIADKGCMQCSWARVIYTIMSFIKWTSPHPRLWTTEAFEDTPFIPHLDTITCHQGASLPVQWSKQVFLDHSKTLTACCRSCPDFNQIQNKQVFIKKTTTFIVSVVFLHIIIFCFT